MCNQILDLYIITGFSLEPHAIIVTIFPTTISAYLIHPHRFLIQITWLHTIRSLA